MRPIVLVFCLVWIQFHDIAAQGLDPDKQLSQYLVDIWNGDQIPTNTVLSIEQTSDGYLWFTTYEGLLRFDGITFEVFDKFNTESIKDNGVRGLYEDPDGTLWIGGNGGGLYRRTADGFEHFEIPLGASSNKVTNFLKDSQGRFWLGTARGLIFLEDSTFHLIVPEGFQPDVDLSVRDIIEDSKQRIWVATSSGLFIYDGIGYSLAYGTEEGIVGEVTDVIERRPGEFWVHAYGSGLVILKDGKISTPGFPNPIKNVNHIFKDSRNNIWIAATKEGVLRITDNDYSKIDASSGLSDNNMNFIAEDHEGSIWLASYYGGLNRLRDGTFTNYSTLDGLSNSTVHCIFQDQGERVWVGTETGLNYFQGGKFYNASRLVEGIENQKVRHILRDSKDRLWVATYAGLFLTHNEKTTRYTIEDGLTSNQVRVVFEDSKGNIWSGTRQGLNKWNTGKWQQFTIKNGFNNHFIMSMVERPNGDLLISTSGGLHIFDTKGIRLLETNNGVIRNTLFRMHQDEDGVVWIGSSEGLLRLDGKKLHSYEKAHRLLGSNVYQVIEDKEKGDLWLVGSKEVTRVPKTQLNQFVEDSTTQIEVSHFDKSNGLKGAGITGVSESCRLKNGEIWFATLNGVSVINPDQIVINETPPPIVIDYVTVNSEKVPVADGKVVLPPNSKNLEIHYTGLSFMIPKKVHFRYRLKGYMDEWRDVGSRRTAYFTTLPPGNFTFQLAACNNDGVWNTDEAALTIEVERAFWQTYWFYIGLTVFVIILIFVVIDLRTKSIKLQNKLLEDKINERTAEVIQQKEEIEAQRDDIEAKNIELEKAKQLISKQYATLKEINESLEEKVNERTKALRRAYLDLKRVNKELDDFVYKSSHDIKGPLARLQGLCNVALMEAKGKDIKQYLNRLKEESILANKIIHKLSHAHAVKSAQIQPIPIQIKGAVDDTINSLAGINGYNKVNFNIDIDKAIMIESDQELLREILVNMVENAIVFRSPDKPKISVSAEYSGGYVRIKIRDNGIGIDKSVHRKIFKMFVKGSERSKGLGLGLYTAKQAASRLGGNIYLKKSEEGKTLFEVVLPRIYTPEVKQPDIMEEQA